MKIEEMIFTDRADCSGCEACANVCPRNAIEMRRDAEGFAYPTINRELCVGCGKCDSVCPALNLAKKIPDVLPKVFAAINPDEKIRRRSSSGGAFTALSEIILRGGGVVFGAGFDKNFRVVHTAARTLDELDNLRGSKYVQSQIGDVYRQVQDALGSTSVLFSGTPCQCAGLKNFLGSDPENLLTVDIICHGTPSPMLWENYIGELGYAHEVKHVNFRSKRNGWNNFCVEVNFADQGHIACPLGQDIFGKLFLDNMTLRPSCHSCKFKFPNVHGDLTLGDAWGVQNFAPEMFDDQGTSLVIVHTTKGAEFFGKTNLIADRVRFVDAAKNSGFIMSLIADPRRKNFFDDVARINDKFAVMQQYAVLDDKDIRQQVDKRSQQKMLQVYQALIEYYRQKFKRNILLITSPLDIREQKFLEEHFEQLFPNCGIYILQSVGNGRLACTENFSLLTFALTEDVNALSDLVNLLRITDIFAEQSASFETSAVIDWLETCGLPLQFFS